MNNQSIAAAKIGDVLNDDIVKGLQLRAMPNRKIFYLRYRTKNGKQRRPKLGEFGVLTLAQARELARGILRRVAAGEDPMAEREAAKAAQTIDELWPQFVSKYLMNPKMPHKPRTIDDYEYMYRRLLKPRFGNLTLPEVTKELVEEMHMDLYKTPVQANRTLAALSTFFGWAVKALKIGHNPCVGIQRFPEAKRERFMSENEAAAIARKLAKYEEQRPNAVAFIYLLILTGARPDEIMRMEWSMLVEDMILMDTHKTDRTGERRVIFLPPAALGVIDRLPRDRKTIVGIESPKHLWRQIREELADEGFKNAYNLRLYDLRHTFASAAIEAGYSLDQVGLLLGHRSAHTTRRYAHLAEKIGRQAAARTADLLEGKMAIPSDEPPHQQ